MKLVLDIKGKKALNPSENDVIIYKGGYYYLTTKEEILSEVSFLLKKCEKELSELKQENEDFKKTVAGQMVQMSELIKTLYSK